MKKKKVNHHQKKRKKNLSPSFSHHFLIKFFFFPLFLPFRVCVSVYYDREKKCMEEEDVVRVVEEDNKSYNGLFVS